MEKFLKDPKINKKWKTNDDIKMVGSELRLSAVQIISL